ncbi:MAG: hypothetical protein A3H98_13565 [Bacteroidetes bacterium RIFCSPLOWO2_02_FULL_36_8]|nr:MAG: hypothetical protein A3H98_13565 [Bacteroidetes bacterium RIFCSPLOWO2_02_FULL_36_8]OFY70651.1 MAG: hypothetical protein A3G23_07940 [Bacteroidetes bacterium RIFCSPLOWO2_12_FULL_37_12]
MKRLTEEIIKSLHLKFGDNLKLCFSDDITMLEEVEIKSRASYLLGQMFHGDIDISDTQKEITAIYPEIFTDLSVSIYLSCCAIDNSPKILLRRVLELGIAIVYLWDMPYKYWNWKKNDDYNNDLNFKEMLDYLNNAGYIDFVNYENSSSITEFINKNVINKVYRELSNVIHGKLENFESNNPDRFNHKKEDLIHILNYTLKIENILLSIWKARFPIHFSKMEKELLAISKYNYDY